MRAPRLFVVPVAAGLVLVLLLGATAAGLRLPGLSYLAALPGFGALDYRTLSAGAFLPLRADYVDGLLGTAFGADGPSRAGLAPSAAGGSRAELDGAPGQPVAAGPDGPGRAAVTVVDHPFVNDDMARALTIEALPFTGRTDTRRATREEAEPDGCSRTGGTAWYRYTARRDGVLTADTFGSDHALSLGVFLAEGRATKRIGCAAGATGEARLAFSVARGRTYLFQLTGPLGGGRLVFHLAALGTTTRASAEVPGRTAEKVMRAAVSGDGRFIAFNSRSADTCIVVVCPGQVYVTDRATGSTQLVSRTPTGAPGNGGSLVPSLSHDGRYVGFGSAASDLVVGDGNGVPDYFVHDRRTGRTTRATVSSQARQGFTAAPSSSHGVDGRISANGRFATFHTVLNGLVEGDDDDSIDVFVHDRVTGRTTRENVTSSGNRGTGPLSAYDPRISRDGRYVAFLSESRLAEADYGTCPEGVAACFNVFLRDRLRGTTRIISVDRAGNADMAVNRHDLSGDGQVVAWTTTSTMGDRSDTNGVSDVFVVRGTGRPTRVSLSHSGEQQDDPGGPASYTDRFSVAGVGRYVALSGDGRRVAFDSRSTNLVPDDSNGRTDIFVRDLAGATTTRVSTSSTGDQAGGDSYRPSLSADGAVVAFESDASDLAPQDDNRLNDIFVHDLGGV